MTYESGYEIVVGVRLIPARAPACIGGSTQFPWSGMLEKKGKGHSTIFVTESRGTPSQRRMVQELLELVQSFDSPSTGPRTMLKTPAVKPFEPEMVFIPAGEFTVGGDPRLRQDAVDDEHSRRTLYLPDYYLARTPVTNAQYAAFVQATSHQPPERWIGEQPPIGKEHHPVVYVSWHNAMAYCHWLTEETGQPYRLPSETEWEKGARDSDEFIYSQGAIPRDLSDMAGNVWEWTQSIYEVYPCDPGNGRELMKNGAGRVLRGGSWFRNQWYARCTLRYGVHPGARYHYLGFRVAASPRIRIGPPVQAASVGLKSL